MDRKLYLIKSSARMNCDLLINCFRNYIAESIIFIFCIFFFERKAEARFIAMKHKSFTDQTKHKSNIQVPESASDMYHPTKSKCKTQAVAEI